MNKITIIDPNHEKKHGILNSIFTKITLKCHKIDHFQHFHQPKKTEPYCWFSSTAPAVASAASAVPQLLVPVPARAQQQPKHLGAGLGGRFCGNIRRITHDTYIYIHT